METDSMNTISRYFQNVKTAWVQNWDDSIFRMHLAFAVMGLLAFLHWGIYYIGQFDMRHGRIIVDPILEKLPPHDFSVFIFGIIYTSLLITLFRLIASPVKLVMGMEACLALLLIRTFCIYLVPLEPPPGMILLNDPFLSWVFKSEATSSVAVKDLFFSGHVSTMFVLIYFSGKGYWKSYLTVATVVLAVLIAWQHVHYTIDLIAAPFFGYICCKVTDQLHMRTDYGLQDSGYEFGYEEAR